MSTEQLTRDQIDELLDKGEDSEQEQAKQAFEIATTLATGSSTVLPPIKVITKHGETFETNGLNTAHYTQVGMYLIVYPAGEEAEAQHIVLPWEQVCHAELKFSQMEELAEELEKDNEGSGD